MRRRKPESHANHERWLVSYADFITLLFAFFTTMYAISTVDAQKVGHMLFALRTAFNLDFFPTQKALLGHSSPEDPPLPHPQRPRERFMPGVVRKPESGPASPGEAHSRDEQRMRSLVRDLQKMVETRKLRDKVSVRLDRRGLVVSLSETAFFDSGEADLREESRAVLDAIVEFLRAADRAVRVEGHTDDRPISTARFPSNWELSTARAVRMVQALEDEYGFAPEALSAAGYADHRPVDTNATPEGRRRNRRVDLVVLDERAATEEPAAEQPAPSRVSSPPDPRAAR